MEVPWNAPVVAPAPVVRVCQVHINTVQTENEEEDLSRLRQIFALLEEHPGNGQVFLSIANGIGTVNMVLERHTVECGETLVQRLAELVGENGVEVREKARN